MVAARLMSRAFAAICAFAIGVAATAYPAAAGTTPTPRPAPIKAGASQVQVVTGSIIRVGGVTYQIAGMRAPRIRRAECFYEKRRGRAAQRALRRLLSRSPVEVAPTGVSTLRGLPLAQVTVRGVDVRTRMIAQGYALPRSGYDRKNPWCVNP